MLIANKTSDSRIFFIAMVLTNNHNHYNILDNTTSTNFIYDPILAEEPPSSSSDRLI